MTITYNWRRRSGFGGIRLALLREGNWEHKDFILTLRASEADGHAVDLAPRGLSWSERLGAHFVYISDEATVWTIDLSDDSVAELSLAISKWGQKRSVPSEHFGPLAVIDAVTGVTEVLFATAE